MDNEQIKSKILADYKTLLALKFDSIQVIFDKLKLTGEHIEQLSRSSAESNEVYKNASDLIQSAMTTEYVALSEAVTTDDKESALAQLKHKVSEACQLLQIHN